MLKLISFSYIHRLNPSALPLGLSRSNRILGGRLFFCSESGLGPNHGVDAQLKVAEETPEKVS